MSVLSLRLPPVLLAVAALTGTALTTSSARADNYDDAVSHEGRPAGDLRRDQIDHPAEVLRLSEIAVSAGAHGVVCSGHEARQVTDRFGDRLAVLVPGVRAAGGAAQDQARVVTPREARDSGARYVIVGRMVTAAADRVAAMDAVLRELA